MAESYEREFFDRTIKFVEQALFPSDIHVALDKLKSAKVAIVADEETLRTANGQHMIFLAVNLLSRFCRHIDLFMSDSIENRLQLPILRYGNVIESLKDLCAQINPYGIFRANPQPHAYDVSLVIGRGTVLGRRTIFINSDGWVAYASAESEIVSAKNNENPVGAQLAACFGAAEVFKAIFRGAEGIQEKYTLPLDSLSYSPLNNTPNEMPEKNPHLPSKLNLDAVQLIGAGAIGCSVAYVLASMPGLNGRVIVTDPQDVEISNLNRLPLALNSDIGKKKVKVISKITTANLEVSAQPDAFQEYFQEVKPAHLGLVVDTVDDVETHWFVQRTFPRVLLNGGTMVEDVSIVRIDDFLNKSCLGCIYPRGRALAVAGVPYATISFTSMMAGILLAAEILKEKVNSLRRYKLNNMVIFNGLDVRKMHRKVIRADKLDSCGVNCKSEETIELYRKIRLSE